MQACVNPAGYGVSATSRASLPCPVGFYNARDTTGPCQACPEGTTTDPGLLGTKLADCGIKAGYGFSAGAILECPVGEIWMARGVPGGGGWVVEVLFPL
jgi:hypothetical protein